MKYPLVLFLFSRRYHAFARKQQRREFCMPYLVLKWQHIALTPSIRLVYKENTICKNCQSRVSLISSFWEHSHLMVQRHVTEKDFTIAFIFSDVFETMQISQYIFKGLSLKKKQTFFQILQSMEHTYYMGYIQTIYTEPK